MSQPSTQTGSSMYSSLLIQILHNWKVIWLLNSLFLSLGFSEDISSGRKRRDLFKLYVPIIQHRCTEPYLDEEK